jgi:5'(3')-deoxyribonucleotidase
LPIRHVFLDMDGVISDFVTAALALHGREDAVADWPVGEWHVSKALGISSSQFWREINLQGHAFWAELPAYSWMDELVEKIREYAPFTILSSPSLVPECLSGKVWWLQQHFAKGFRDFLIGPHKHHCAKPDVVLIDDSDENVQRFRAHGGQAILFPQVWNQNHAIADRIEFVACQLHELNAS